SLDDELIKQYRRDRVIGKDDYILICTHEPLELGIVLDSSVSIRDPDFKACKEFLQNYLQQFDIGSGPRSVRVSLITYGRGTYKQDAFNLTTYSSKDDVINAIGRVPHRKGDYTDTGLGIRYMDEVQLADGVVRPGVVKVGLVITDGESQEPEKTRSAAQAARADGIVTFAVGVGKSVKDTELQAIAGDSKRVVKVGNYDELNTITESLAQMTCIKQEEPTTQLPADQPCGALHPSDIYFVFSPASLGTEATSWATSFISVTIGSSEMEVGFRYGVVSGSCPDDAGFDLDDYDNVNDIRRRLSSYTERKVPSLLKRLSQDGYTRARGARDGAKRVAVLFATNGKERLDEHVRSLVAQNVTVYLADPLNSGLVVAGASTLSGRLPGYQADDFI
ncbi:unnamed protein product, partial [Lymnaea stagnalis]